MRASKAATPKSAAILSIRRVKKREGKPQRFARAVRATIFTPLTPRQARYLREWLGRPNSSEGGQVHQQGRPTTGAFL